MRIIDDKITGDKLSVIGEVYHTKINPRTSKKKYHRSYPAGRIEKYANDTTEYYQLVFQYLSKNINSLFYGDLSELKKINKQVKRILTQNKLTVPKFAGTTFGVVFNYSWFRANEKIRNDWFKSLGIKVCPYCNRNFLSIAKQNKKAGAEEVLYFDIDHFFPKEKYPWLALSFYNLIPSCTICNQRIKGKEELLIKKTIHPFEDDMDKILKFTVPVDSLEVFISNKLIKLEIIPRTPYSIGSRDYIRAKNTYMFFNLENLYNTHLDYVRELIQKDIVYSQSYIDQLYLDFGSNGQTGIFSSRSDMMKMLFGNYVLPEQIHERPLAKLTKDLMEDFSLNTHN